jgi:parvulin-like peptidyl-prolyl isomerase
MIRFVLVLAVLATGTACSGAPGGPSMNNKMGTTNELPPPMSPVVSKSILEREPVANTAMVKHILISWKDLADSFGGRQDKRAAARTKTDAETQVKSLVGQIKAGGNFDEIMQTHSEDVGSASTGRPFKVTPDAQLVIEFRQLALRLAVDEVGVCQSDFGFHIIKRLQ